MGDRFSPSPCVVTGIDGSRSALQAALWAVDEAVDRDIPLRLVCAANSTPGAPGNGSAEVTAAECAVHDAFTAIGSTGKPVTVEAAIVHGGPVAALAAASRSAEMLCVGSTGLKHAVWGQMGSTASALAASAHCPVAIVPASAGLAATGWVLAVVDRSAGGNTVLDLAVSEARLRSAPLRVLTTWRNQHTDTQDADRIEAGAQLERHLAPWRRTHPDVNIVSTAGDFGVVDHVAQLHRNAEPVQLLVADPGRPGATDVLFGPAGRGALEAARCTLLISDRHCWL